MKKNKKGSQNKDYKPFPKYFTALKQREKEWKKKKIESQFHYIQQSEKKKQISEISGKPKSFYEKVFSGEIDLEEYEKEFDPLSLYPTSSKQKSQEEFEEEFSEKEEEEEEEKLSPEKNIRNNRKYQINAPFSSSKYSNAHLAKEIFNKEDEEEEEEEDEDEEEEKEIEMNENKNNKNATTNSKLNSLTKARMKWELKQQEIEKKKNEKQERLAGIEKKKKQRINQRRLLNKKTKRGQPVMKHKMEHLLSKIQKNINQQQ